MTGVPCRISILICYDYLFDFPLVVDEQGSAGMSQGEGSKKAQSADASASDLLCVCSGHGSQGSTGRDGRCSQGFLIRAELQRHRLVEERVRRTVAKGTLSGEDGNTLLGDDCILCLEYA